jgi:hypothetical protein
MMIGSATFSFFLLFLFSASIALGLSIDPRLIQLVPPQSHLVAGMSRSAGQGTTGSFLLIAAENKADLNDFFALTGGDASRHLNALVFVRGGADPYTSESQHSLLVSGRFDRESIFRFAASGAGRGSYRQIPVLVVPPFQRERETFHEERWLAVLDEQIAVFGSVASVQRELDRWIERNAPDQSLIDRLRRLQGHDDSWCVLLARDRQGIGEKALGKLDRKLGEVAHEGGLLAYGIEFGRKVEVVVAAEPSLTNRSLKAPNDVPTAESGAAMHVFSFLPDEAAGSRAAVKVSRKRYEEWIDGFENPDPSLARSATR